MFQKVAFHIELKYYIFIPMAVTLFSLDFSLSVNYMTVMFIYNYLVRYLIHNSK